MSTIRRIALVYREVGTIGGIQKTAALLESWLREWGYSVEVFSERDLGAGTERRENLGRILNEGRFDLVVDNDTYVEDKLRADISAAQEAGAKIVAVWHSVFSWMLALGLAKASRIFSAIRKADAVIALSPSDEAAFRTLGCRSLFIPGVDNDRMPHFVRNDHPHRIIWIGRLVDLKQPLDAVRIVEKVRAAVPDAVLEMLGDGNENVKAKIDRYVASRPLLKDAVRLCGYVKDVDRHLTDAGIGLVTSEFEGFCHAIVEMKMASLPVVSYAMPYLETLKEGTGAVQVAQGDVEAAADRLAMLFSNPDETARHGARARRAYEELRAFDQRGAYERLFADLAEPDERSTLLAADLASAPRLFDILVRHGVTGLGALERRVERRLTGSRDVPGIRGKIGRLLVKLGKRFCGA